MPRSWLVGLCLLRIVGACVVLGSRPLPVRVNTLFPAAWPTRSRPGTPRGMFTFGAEKPASATPDKDLLGAAEMGDHDALMKAIEDGAWLEPNPSPGLSPGPSLTLTPAP